MKNIAKSLLLMSIVAVSVIVAAFGEKQAPLSPFVDDKGAIALPTDFKSQASHLGTWVITSQTTTSPDEGLLPHGTGIHNIYTQPGSIEAYNQSGKWPDGTMLVLEVSPIQWDDVPTGHVMYAGEPAQWFVMVKDAKGRFKSNPNWESGWGWASFKAGEPNKNISTIGKKDCLGCHDAARDTDFVFKDGYPALR